MDTRLKHESANSSEYYSNTPGTSTMTNTPNPGDQAVEAVALEKVREGFCYLNCPRGTEQNWPHDPACETMRAAVSKLNRLSAIPPHTGLFARAAVRERLAVSMEKHGGVCREAVAADIRSGSWDDGPVFFAMLDALSVIPTPPPADHTDLIAAAYMAGATDVHDAWIAGNGQTEADFGEAASDYAADLLQSHASPREWQDSFQITEGICERDPFGKTFPAWMADVMICGFREQGWGAQHNGRQIASGKWGDYLARTALELG